MLEGRALLAPLVADTVTVASSGLVTITGSSVAGQASNFLVQWGAAGTVQGTTQDVYFITEQNPKLAFANPAAAGLVGVGILKGTNTTLNPPNVYSEIEIFGLSPFVGSFLNVAIHINDGVNGDTVNLYSIGPAPVAVNDIIGGTTDNITVGNVGVAGLSSITGPVSIVDRNSATNLTIDDTGDGFENQGVQFTASSFGTTVQVPPAFAGQGPLNVSVDYSNAILNRLTFNTTGKNTMGSAVTISDYGIVQANAGLTAVVNDHGAMDNITVTSFPQAPTDGSGSLTINAKKGESVTLGSTSSMGLQTIQGNNVTLAGGPINLTVNDAGDPNGVHATISSTSISGLAPATINYGTATSTTSTALSTLSISGGSGSNTFNVMSLPSLPSVPGLPMPNATNLTTGTNSANGSTVNVAAAALNGAALNVVGAGANDVVNLDASMLPGLTVAPASGPLSVAFAPSATGGLTSQVGTVNITDTLAPKTNPVPITATQGAPATVDVADFNLPVAPTNRGLVSGLTPTVSINLFFGEAATTGMVVEDKMTPGLFHVMGTHTFNMATTANTPDSVMATITGNAGFSVNGVTINEIATPLVLPMAAATVTAASGGGGGGNTPLGPNFVQGALNPASDTGASNSDFITNSQTAQFQGKTNPGAAVTLFAQGVKSFTPRTPVGTAVADSSGNWSITSFALPADSYQFTVQSVDSSGSMAMATLTTAAKPLVIELTGPVIDSATLNAKAQQILVVFQDAQGMSIPSLANPAAYAISGKGVGRITTVNVSGSGPMVSVAITFSTRKGSPKKATFLVRSNVVTDVAGNPLDGEFLNRFPTGNGTPGGNFLVNLPVKIKPVKKSGGGVTVIVHT